MNRLNSIMRCIGFFFLLLISGGCQVNKDKSSTLIYKILTNQQWDAIKQNGFTLEYGTELDKKVSTLKPKVVIVDYVNQVKRAAVSNSRMGQYDWTEQIEVSKTLKQYANAISPLRW